VSLPIKGSFYLEHHFKNPIPIGLCVLDNTKALERNMQWGVEKFQDLLKGILAIAGRSMHSILG